jgi:hypothetical protein
VVLNAKGYEQSYQLFHAMGGDYWDEGGGMAVFFFFLEAMET